MNADMEELARLRRQDELVSLIGKQTFTTVAKALGKSRVKYLQFAVDHGEAVDVVTSEMLEWKAQAMRVDAGNAGGGESRLARAEEEALHVIVTLIRYLNREYEARGHERHA